MKPGPTEQLTISAQAAHWLCVLTDDEPQTQAAFLTWLRRSPQHVEEFLFATATWKKLHQAGATGTETVEEIAAAAHAADCGTNVVALQPRMAPAAPVPVDPVDDVVPVPASRRGRIEREGGRWAAAAALLAFGATLVWLATGSGSTYTTAVGEQRTVQLNDGSVLYLNTDSRVRVHFSEEQRTVQLLKGEALLNVAQESARPFQVTSPTAVVQVVGTQFNIRNRPGNTVVSVLEGRVRVAGRNGTHGVASTAPADQLAGAGEEVSVAGDGRIVKHRPQDIAQSITWRERRLVFRAARLEEVVAEINRYSPRRFYIEGESARNTRLTASFNVDDPQSLANFLQRYSKLTVEHSGENFTIRGASHGPAD